MKSKIIGLALLLLVVTTTPAAAQSVPNGSEVSLDEALNEDDVCAPINAETAVCDASIEDDTATLIIDSETRQSVILTDAGGMMLGGEIRRQPRLLQEGRNRIEFKVTVYRGNAGLTIDTGDVLFGVPIKERNSLLGPPVTATDVQASALGGASAVALAILIMVYRAARGTDDQPERVA